MQIFIVNVKAGGTHNYCCAIKDEEFSMKVNSSTGVR
jgi:hypothetical protein